MIQVALKGLGDVVKLRAALTSLSARLPQANPGPAQSGDPDAVTDQMIQALVNVAGRINFPSEVQTALKIGGVVISLSETVKRPIRILISRYASPLATVISAYNTKLSLLPGGLPPKFPNGSIATRIGSSWAVGIPGNLALKGAALKGIGCGGCGSCTSCAAPMRTLQGATLRGSSLKDSVITLEGAGSLGFLNPYSHYGIYPDPGNAKPVSSTEYAASTGWKPWYKRWWAIGGMAVGGVGVVSVLGWLIFGGKKRRGR